MKTKKRQVYVLKHDQRNNDFEEFYDSFQKAKKRMTELVKEHTELGIELTPVYFKKEKEPYLYQDDSDDGVYISVINYDLN